MNEYLKGDLNPKILLNHCTNLNMLGGLKNWRTAQTDLTSLLKRDSLSEQSRIAALNQRGLSLRMTNQYYAAESDFLAARNLAHEKGWLATELTALAGLIDVHRTGDRDTAPFVFGKHLDIAQTYQQEAENIVKQIPTSNVPKIDALLQFGLLSLETEKYGYTSALRYYHDAKLACDELRRSDLTNVTLINRQARINLLQGGVYEKLGIHKKIAGKKDAMDYYYAAYDDYSVVRDIRGIANAALGMARMCTIGYSKIALYKWACEVTQDKDPELHQMAEIGLAQLLQASV